MKILNIGIVNSSELKSIWKGKMQIIETDTHGTCIELPENVDYRFQKQNKNPGYDWSKRLGEELTEGVDFEIVKNNGFNWLKVI